MFSGDTPHMVPRAGTCDMVGSQFLIRGKVLDAEPHRVAEVIHHIL